MNMNISSEGIDYLRYEKGISSERIDYLGYEKGPIEFIF
jgi:hypothetical protein